MIEDHSLMMSQTTFTMWVVRFSPAGNWKTLDDQLSAQKEVNSIQATK
jgi:hypothetical protein